MRKSLFSSSVLFSIICGALVFFLFKYFGFEETFYASNLGESYVVLAVDEFHDDRYILESLNRSGLAGIVSESSQEIPLDDFGVLKMVPLDSFHKKMEEYDPRDDGYAEKLRAFFVRDGKRFFFLPLDGVSGKKISLLEKQLPSILAGYPYELTISGRKKPFLWCFFLLAAASGAALFFSPSRRLFALEIPVLLCFGWGGPAAIVLAAILSGIWELLRVPLKELSAARCYKRSMPDYAGAGFEGIRERFRPFRLNLYLVLFFLILFIVFSVTGELPFILPTAGSAFFFFIFFLAYRTEARRARKTHHILFTPVLIFHNREKTFSLFPFLLSFAAGAALALLPLLSSTRAQYPLVDPDYLVRSEDYQRHISYQRSFPYRSLDQAWDTGQEGYMRYFLGEDGLIAGSTNYTEVNETELSEFSQEPPFPLEKLIDFLVYYPEPGVFIKEWISVAMILLICVLDLFRPGIRYNKKNPVLGDKRIAA